MQRKLAIIVQSSHNENGPDAKKHPIRHTMSYARIRKDLQSMELTNLKDIFREPEKWFTKRSPLADGFVPTVPQRLSAF